MEYEKEMEIKNRLIFLSRLIKNLVKFFSKEFIEALNFDFFSMLLGIKNSFKVSEEKDSEQIILLVLLLRLTGGVELEIKNESGSLYIINNSKQTVIRKSDSLAIKDIFLEYIFGDLYAQKESDLKILVILTCNRPLILQECLKKYIRNFRIFGHEMKIIISDDSNHVNSEMNSYLTEELKRDYPNILYIDKKTKYNFVKDLTDRALKEFPGIDSKKLEYYIPYTFGGDGFESSYGRNRNFVSLYMNENSFVMVDDDSMPLVLAYSSEVLKDAIKEMINENIYDLHKLESYIKDKPETCFYDVDFIGYFKTYEIDEPKYVKYSGSPDVETYIYHLKQLGADFNEIETFDLVKEKDKLRTGVFLYGERDNKNPLMRGLCCYFPKNSYNLRVTIPEKYRAEDVFLGANHLVFSGKKPFETSFSLYHNKENNVPISAKDINSELTGGVIFSFYLAVIRELINKSSKNIVIDFYNRMENKISISSEAFEILNIHKRKIINLYKNYVDYTEKKHNNELSVKLNEIVISLEQEFFGLPEKYYEEQIEVIVNKVLKDFASCMILWITLRKVNMGNLYAETK